MDRQHRSRDASHASSSSADAAVPGKRSLTESLSAPTTALQARAAGPGKASAADIHEMAGRGIAGPAGPLPFLDAIQRAFGRHDVSRIRSHVDGDAAAAAQGIGAEAYAAGEHVAFAGPPTLHTAAHEAAHVVQQRAGVRLPGGVGQTGDPYEQHADAVADRVVRGESAEALLDEYTGGGEHKPADASDASDAPIQRKPSDFVNAFGGHPQLNLPLNKQIQKPAWNTYVLNIRPYLAIEDDDEDKQASWFYLTSSRERSLRAEAETESLKDKKQQDPWKVFSSDQLVLSGQIAGQLELEKAEVFGDSIGRLDTQQGGQKIRVQDAKITPGNSNFVGHEDPGASMNRLFTHTPSMDDVKQGNLGDCYLLAAVASVIHRDPGHFVRHMKDNVDGTVAVKLYSAVGTALEVTIDKSVAGEKFARNVLWVKLLEKAYVASGLKTNTVGNGGQNAYQDINGGAPEQALLHLTGKAVDTFALGQERRRFQLAAPGLAMEAVKDIREKIDGIGKKQDVLQEQIKQKQLLDTKADVSAETTQIQEHQKEIGVLFNEWKTIDGPRQELEDMLTRVYVSEQTFTAFMEKHGENELLRKVVSKAGFEKGTLPGALGSGLYGRDELAAFNQIKKAIDAKLPMAASTKKSIKDLDNPEEKEKGLAGESKVNGLASGHAYSVLDYKPTPNQYRQGDPVMIQLRNPWGSYGRKYEKVLDKVKGVADSGGDGTFWIDLADLVAYFDSLAISR